MSFALEMHAFQLHRIFNPSTILLTFFHSTSFFFRKNSLFSYFLHPPSILSVLTSYFDKFSTLSRVLLPFRLHFFHFLRIFFGCPPILQSFHAYIISIGLAAIRPVFATHFDNFQADISWRYCQRCVVFRFTSSWFDRTNWGIDALVWWCLSAPYLCATE